MKSHEWVRRIVQVYEYLLSDIRYALPQLEKSLQMDLETIRRTSKDRGIHFFVVDLPQLGKHLDRCMSKERWSPCGSCASRARSKGNILPKLFGGLFDQLFEADGCLKQVPNLEAYGFLRQVLYLCKKLPLTYSEASLRDSVAKFVSEDASLPEPERFWTESDPADCFVRITYRGFHASRYYAGKVVKDSLTLDVLETLKNLDTISRDVCQTLGYYNPEEWRFKHGPGAISQVSGPTNKYHWYGWTDALESVYPIADYGFHNYASWADKVKKREYEDYTPHSRLVAVPKTFNKPRLIAAEPNEHQWCQQNIWNYLEARVKNSWIGLFIRFRDQDLNQSLCSFGSKDGSLCTVDLSSASDRVSCRAVGNLFWTHPALVQALRATRTRVLVQNLNKDLPQRIELKKFSTMGSAVTFPIQSILFLCVALATCFTKYRLRDPRKEMSGLFGKVAVFGDDIIVPNDCRELLQQVLEVLDFKVNDDKTFSEGFFRESCGVDMYRGVDVTPVYLHDLTVATPESVASMVDTCNNFYKKFYITTSVQLGSTLPNQIGTVHQDSGVFGLKSRVGTHLPRKRWNGRYQRDEVRVLSVCAKQSLRAEEDDSALHQFFSELPSPYENWEAGTRLRPKLRMKFCWVSRSDCMGLTTHLAGSRTERTEVRQI